MPCDTPIYPLTRRPLAAALILALALAAPVCAQDGFDEPPPEPPIEEPLPELPPADPGAQPIPGLGETDFRIRSAPLIAEGTFLIRRPGRVIILPTGERVFAFSPDERGTAMRPMVLIPSLTLQRMEQAAEGRETAFIITGEVFMYLGVNYLLPDVFTVIAPETIERPPEQPQETPASPPTGRDPAIEELIRDLERQRQRPRVVDPSAARVPEPAAPDRPSVPDDAGLSTDLALRAPGAAAAAGLLTDRQTLDRRRGRLIRLPGGEWAIAFDNGPRHDPLLDRPLILVPSLTLQRMQTWAGRMGDAVPIEVSGRITQYRGRNYLIPTVFRLYPVTTPLEPIQ